MEEPRNGGEAVDVVTDTLPTDKVEVDQVEIAEGSDVASQDDPVEALAQAQEDLQEALARADASHQSYLRAVADLENYRKRMRREQESISGRATGRALMSLLPVLDSFDAALSLDVSSEEETPVLSGMKATYDLLLGTLQNQGLEVVPTAGHPFSPDLHQPVNAPPEGEGEIMVTSEVRRGYQLDGRLLRAALVVVSREDDSE